MWTERRPSARSLTAAGQQICKAIMDQQSQHQQTLRKAKYKTLFIFVAIALAVYISSFFLLVE